MLKKYLTLKHESNLLFKLLIQTVRIKKLLDLSFFFIILQNIMYVHSSDLFNGVHILKRGNTNFTCQNRQRKKEKTAFVNCLKSKSHCYKNDQEF